MTVRVQFVAAVVAVAVGFATSLAAQADALSDARKLLSEGKFIEAEAALSAAVESPILAPEAYYTWYQSLRARGEGERALRKLETAAKLAADRADWWLELGLYSAELGRTDEAAAHYLTALSIAPGFGQAHAALSGLLLDLGRTAEAEAQLREGLRADPRFAGNWVSLADLLLSQERPLDALALLDQGMEACPGNAPISIARGRVYDTMGEFTRALEAYQQAVSSDPANPAAHLFLGRALRARGQLGPAMASYRRAAALATDDPEPWVEMAWLTVEDRKAPGAARQHSSKALALAPGDCRANAVHGWALVSSKQTEKGLELISKTVDAHPKCPDAAYAMALAVARDGDKPQAVVWLQQAAREAKDPALQRRASGLAKQLQATEANAGQ